MQELKIHGIYKHFKGDHYIVEDVAIHSETKEKLVNEVIEDFKKRQEEKRCVRLYPL